MSGWRRGLTCRFPDRPDRNIPALLFPGQQKGSRRNERCVRPVHAEPHEIFRVNNHILLLNDNVSEDQPGQCHIPPTMRPISVKFNCRYFPNRLEFWFMQVWALPKASSNGEVYWCTARMKRHFAAHRSLTSIIRFCNSRSPASPEQWIICETISLVDSVFPTDQVNLEQESDSIQAYLLHSRLKRQCIGISSIGTAFGRLGWPPRRYVAIIDCGIGHIYKDHVARRDCFQCFEVFLSFVSNLFLIDIQLFEGIDRNQYISNVCLGKWETWRWQRDSPI